MRKRLLGDVVRGYWMLVIAAMSLGNALAEAGTSIFFIRHGETMGNVTGDYSEKNQATFSPRGEQQVALVPEVLSPYAYDYIAVSPTWRTKQTILPYLKAFGGKGVIWPELEEGGCGLGGLATPASIIPQGEPVVIEPELSRFFEVRDEDAVFRFAPTDNAESLAIYLQGMRKLKEQFAGTGKSVLLVSHSCTGSRYFELLLGLEPRGRFSPQNTALSRFMEQSNGVYRMVLYNNQPFHQAYRWKAVAKPVGVGEPREMVLTLCGEYFGAASETGYRLEWSLANASNKVSQRGMEHFSVMTNTESELYAIVIQTGEMTPGENAVLQSSLYEGDVLVQAWEQAVRIPDTLNLSGTWKIQAGDDLARAEVAYDDQAWSVTKVPGAWETDALPDYDGTAWYRYSFTIPEECGGLWGDEPLAVLLGAVDDADVSYLDGQRIGASGHFPPEKISAYDTVRIYSIPFPMRPGTKHVLAVCVSDWFGNGGIWKGPVVIGPEKSLRSMPLE